MIRLGALFVKWVVYKLKNTKIQSHHIVAFSGLVMFPIAVFGPLGYATLFPITAWLAFAFKFIQDRKFAPFPKRNLLLLISLHVWGAVTAFWSIYVERTIILSISLIALSASGILLWKTVQSYSKTQRLLILNWMTIGFSIGIVLLGFEAFSDGLVLKWIKSESDPLMYKFNKATSIFSILIWPIIMGNFRQNRKLLSLTLLLVSILVIFSLQSDTSKIAFIIGAVGFGLSYRFRSIPALSAWGLFFVILIMPLLSQTIFKFDNFVEISPVDCKNSLIHRLNVWEYVGTQIRLKPLHGWGLDTARSEQFSNQTVECKFKDKTTGDYYPSDLDLEEHAIFLDQQVPIMNLRANSLICMTRMLLLFLPLAILQMKQY